MVDRSDIDRIVAANLYCVLSTADQHGQPWATPVFFAPLGTDRVCWVSSPTSRHSRNIAERTAIAVAVYDSTVAVGHAEAAYFDADAGPCRRDDLDSALTALNRRLPTEQRLTADELLPAGALGMYQATVRRRYVLVRGGNTEYRNVLDMTVEV